MGRCNHCGAWGSLQKKRSVGAQTAKPKHGLFLSGDTQTKSLAEVEDSEMDKLQSYSSEFNQVMGGGIVPGSVTLIGGEPGIGKSTLLLQLAAAFAAAMPGTKRGQSLEKVLYLSAEESTQQIKLRSKRLGVDQTQKRLLLSTDNNLESFAETVTEMRPDLVIVDSIQTIYLPEIDSIPGAPRQIRECCSNLMRLAKSTNIPIIIVGHINKDGDLAGPKILEHMVDTVLQFEGERDGQLRFLRSIKNRFGATDEVALFAMTELGLKDLDNPSELFLEQRAGGIVFASKEGKRSLLLEMQSLVLSTEYAHPRRVANGIDYNRLQQILAILEKKLSLSMAKADIYCNVAGGMQLKEPAADLAIALSLIVNCGAFKIDPQKVHGIVALGELGLGAEIRSITNIEARVAEAAKLGFKTLICPMLDRKLLAKISERYPIKIFPCKNIHEAKQVLLN